MPHTGFIHHFRRSGIDAICSHCKRVVATAETLEQLKPAQLKHKCRERADRTQASLGPVPMKNRRSGDDL